MAVIVFYYNKCNGNGICVRECSSDLLVVTQDGQWCKPKDEEVGNSSAVKEFNEMIRGKSDFKKIAFELENCAECYRCETSCPAEAIELREE